MTAMGTASSANPRVLVALSGGVDSSVAAWLLKEQGYDCVGAVMRLHDGTGTADTDRNAGIETDPAGNEPDDVASARAVAERLGIPFHVLDRREVFTRDVIEPFVAAYECGITPNPCCICNRRIKFGALLDAARELGCTHLATGHYARIVRTADGAPALAKARDLAKDQSYFLYGLSDDALAHVLFPLGDLTKEGDVRRIAREQGLAPAERRDSQGICFVPDNDFASFIERWRDRALEAGDILDTSGRVIGRHRGAIRYTVGQRRGLGVAAAHPLYVTAVDARANTVTLGGEVDLMARALIARNWIWTGADAAHAAALDVEAEAPVAVCAKIRYHQPDQEAVLHLLDSDDRLDRTGTGPVMRIDFAEPQRGIAPGQAVVVYRGDAVLGGGTVERALR